MSKSKYNYSDEFYDEEVNTNKLFKQLRKDKKKEKRINHALKTKNIDELIHYTEEDDNISDDFYDRDVN